MRGQAGRPPWRGRAPSLSGVKLLLRADSTKARGSGYSSAHCPGPCQMLAAPCRTLLARFTHTPGPRGLTMEGAKDLGLQLIRGHQAGLQSPGRLNWGPHADTGDPRPGSSRGCGTFLQGNAPAEEEGWGFCEGTSRPRCPGKGRNQAAFAGRALNEADAVHSAEITHGALRSESRHLLYENQSTSSRAAVETYPPCTQRHKQEQLPVPRAPPRKAWCRAVFTHTPSQSPPLAQEKRTTILVTQPRNPGCRGQVT